MFQIIVNGLTSNIQIIEAGEPSIDSNRKSSPFNYFVLLFYTQEGGGGGGVGGDRIQGLSALVPPRQIPQFNLHAKNCGLSTSAK